MGTPKITPKIRQFITDNRTMASRALAALIWKKFQVRISHATVNTVLDEVRLEKSQENNAKVEAVRSKILDDADKWANKYLQYTDEEIESLRKLIKASEEGDKPVCLETARDRLAASTALHKMLSTIIDFVKPEESKTTINVNADISKLSEEELEEYGRLASKLAGVSEGKGQKTSS
jgi:formate dehydrogenase maturation protein FdhE